MADVISRLKLDSGEFDSKIKRAGQELMAYSEHCKKMGLEMGYANKDAKDFAKALGSMQTTSSSARGKINELTEAFVNLKVMYKNMTDEEKNNTFGKNLAASLDQLKTRIDQAKAELNDVNAELGNTKQAEIDTNGGLEGLTSALGINIKTLAGWGTAIAAGKVALDVAKDAFFASESSVDEWGRTMAASQSLYEGFLTAINNGDISGYLSRMDEIVQAARAAYNELDTLGTMKTIQAPKMSAQQTENERLRMMIQTGRYIAPVDGRKASMKDGQLLTPAQIKTLERQLQNGMQSVVKLVGNEVKQTGKAIDAYYNSIAKQNGMSLQEFKKGTSSWEEFSKKMQGYQQYQKWRQENSFTDMYGNRQVREGNPYQEFKKWGTFRVDKMGDNSYNDLVRLIQQRDQQAAQAYGMQSQAYRTMNRAEGVTVRQLMGGGSGGGRKGGNGGNTDIQFADDSIMAQEKLVSDLTQKWKTASAEMKGGYLVQLNEAKAKLEEMTKGPNLDKLFPDLSAQKYYTGTVSRGDALMQSIRADIGRENMAVDQSSLKNIMTMAMKEGLDTSEIDANGLLERIFNGEDIPTEFWNGLMDRLNEALHDFGREAYDLDEKGNLKQRQRPEEKENIVNIVKQDNVALKQLEKFNGDYSKVTGGVSSIVSGIQQMGVDIPEEIQSVLGVLTGISSIMTGITSILSLILIAENIQTTESTIKSIPVIGWALAHGGIVPHAANGYFVPGTHYSGDVTPIMANAGELVLNKAQQGNLASQLSGGGMQNLQLGTKVTAEEIIFILKNNGRRTGKGEFVQTNSRRV